MLVIVVFVSFSFLVFLLCWVL